MLGLKASRDGRGLWLWTRLSVGCELRHRYAFFPRDFVLCLSEAAAREGADLTCAASGSRAQPVSGLWPVRLAAALRYALEVEGIRKIDIWTARYHLAIVEFPAQPFDPFFNVNRFADLAEAERLLALVDQP